MAFNKFLGKVEGQGFGKNAGIFGTEMVQRFFQQEFIYENNIDKKFGGRENHKVFIHSFSTFDTLQYLPTESVE